MPPIPFSASTNTEGISGRMTSRNLCLALGYKMVKERREHLGKLKCDRQIVNHDKYLGMSASFWSSPKFTSLGNCELSNVSDDENDAPKNSGCGL